MRGPSPGQIPSALQLRRKKVNGSPQKLALLWAWSDFRTVCRLLRTGQACAPAVETVVSVMTGLQRWWGDAFFFIPPLLYSLCQFLFCCRLSLDFLFILLCVASLLCSVFYISKYVQLPFLNTLRCLFFFFYHVFFRLPFFWWTIFVASLLYKLSCKVDFICHMDFFF